MMSASKPKKIPLPFGYSVFQQEARVCTLNMGKMVSDISGFGCSGILFQGLIPHILSRKKVFKLLAFLPYPTSVLRVIARSTRHQGQSGLHSRIRTEIL